jgi:hypothetical protein
MFWEASALKPDDPEPHQNLADIYSTQHRLPEAQQERALAASLLAQSNTNAHPSP